MTENLLDKKSVLSFLLAPLLFIAACAPVTTFAQAYVPVIDIQLNPAFSQYVDQFNLAMTTAPDSLRDIIAGPDPQGVAAEDCHMRNANDYVFAYENGPWAAAIASTSGGLPATIPPGGSIGNPADYIQVFGQGTGGVNSEGNDSGSIRCILTSLVGYQKIALYVQIQQMLKAYIADAQQKQLSNQLLNRINAANLTWSKQGEQVTADGVQTTEPVYVLDSTKSGFGENDRTLSTVLAQSTAAPGDPVGSLQLAWPLDTATAVAQNTRDETQDPRDTFTQVTQSTLTDPIGPFPAATDGTAAFNDYMLNANTPEGLGAVDTLDSMIQSPQNTPTGSIFLVQNETDRRLDQEEARRNGELANTGFRPTKQCSGNDGDPYCDPAYMTDMSPGAQNQEVVTSAAQSGQDQIAQSTNLDTTAADAAESLSSDINTQPSGVYGYNTTPLGTTQTGVNQLVKELYDTIQYAYFDLNGDQEQWAQGALLSIYDEMKFNDQQPQETVTNGTAPDPVPY